MEKPELEELIARKVAEAKAEMTIKREEKIAWLATFIMFVFGFVYPIVQSNKSTDRTDAAIQNMNQTLIAMENQERSNADLQMQKLSTAIDKLDSKTERNVEKVQGQFKELAGKQLRKAKLQATYNGKPLEGSTVAFSDLVKPGSLLQVKNIGDGPTTSIVTMKVYGKEIPFTLIPNFQLATSSGRWSKASVPIGDESSDQFDTEFEFQRDDLNFVIIDVNQTFQFFFQFQLPSGTNIASLPAGKTYNMQVKLWYGETPYRIPFKVKVE